MLLVLGFRIRGLSLGLWTGGSRSLGAEGVHMYDIVYIVPKGPIHEAFKATAKQMPIRP